MKMGIRGFMDGMGCIHGNYPYLLLTVLNNNSRRALTGMRFLDGFDKLPRMINFFLEAEVVGKEANGRSSERCEMG
jgi:hypothetical protein